MVDAATTFTPAQRRGITATFVGAIAAGITSTSSDWTANAATSLEHGVIAGGATWLVLTLIAARLTARRVAARNEELLDALDESASLMRDILDQQQPVHPSLRGRHLVAIKGGL